MPRNTVGDDDDPITHTVRYSIHGPLLNDMDSFLDGKIPLTALHLIDFTDLGDVRAARDIGSATSAEGFVEALRPFDSACFNWVFADTEGPLGWNSPCRIPLRITTSNG